MAERFDTLTMTREEVGIYIKSLKNVFDIVRLVNVSETTQFSIDDNGNIIAQPHQCYAVWNKERRCENCISAKAFFQKGKLSKFEFIDNAVYFVISEYIEIEDQPYMLEMVLKVTDETLFGAYGQNDFVQKITEYNQKLYIDPLTGIYNRYYYDEQLSTLAGVSGIAMLDLDNLKIINDTFGHAAGDLALKTVATLIKENMRTNAAAVRFGGDEFVLVLRDTDAAASAASLERLRLAAEVAHFAEYPEMTISVSIGAAVGKISAATAMRRADRKLYEAKKQKNAVCIETL